MERTSQQVISSSGKTQMRTIFESFGWAVREFPQDTDVGIDFEIEVFENYTSTGIFFKVQLKSSMETGYSRKRDGIREYVKRKHLTYYIKELTDPLILIHADVRAGKTFWLAPQLINVPGGWLDGTEPDRRAPLSIPTKNELPTTVPDLMKAVARIKLITGTRAVLETPIPQFLADIKELANESEVICELQNKVDALKLSQVQQLYKSHKLEEAVTLVDRMLADSDCSTENRFWALLEKERLDYRVSAESGAVPQGALPNIFLKCAKALQQITKNGPPALKFSALIRRKSAELDLLAHQACGLATNYHNLVAHESGYWALHAYVERQALDRRVARKISQCIRLANYAANSSHRYALPTALCRIPQAIVIYLVSLRNDNRPELAEKIAATAFQICQLAAWIAERSGNEEEIVLASSAAVGLASAGGDEYIEWARVTAKKIKDSLLRDEGMALVERQIRRVKGERLPGDLWGEATPEQIYTNMAFGMGINMSDPDDPMTKLVQIAIADAEPTRVFSTCRSIFVSLGPMKADERYILERLGAAPGPKIIHCEKHRHRLMGSTLDEAFGSFNSRYCSTCPDKLPRSNDWKYTHEWHDREGNRLRKLGFGF